MTNICIRRWNQLINCQSKYYTSQMHEVLINIEQVINTSSHILKHDHTSTVAVVKIDNQDYVIKRANTKNALHFFRRLMMISRARKNRHYAQILSKLGIKT